MPWDETVTQRWRNLTRSKLPADQRAPLLKKYSPIEAVTFLKAPALNHKCKIALKSNSIVKRDKYNSKNQDHVNIALCAFGEAISNFLRLAIQQALNPEVRLAVAKVNNGTKILAALFYRLSLTRRAQITSVLNLTAKYTADAIPADDLLFGASFGERIKKATSMEKSSKDILKTPLVISKKIQQPFR